MNVVCLIIDRLHVGQLGCYGNAWIATPGFDRLAADGFLFDQALAESPELADFYAALISGVAARAQNEETAAQASLIERLAAAGVASTLISDDPTIADLPSSAGLADVIQVPCEGATDTAATLEETQLARYFAVAIEWLQSAKEPFCLFAHCGSLGATWDAPYEYRERYADEDEPAPPEGAAVPALTLDEDYDPDELLGICQAYAGQVSALDTCVAALVAQLEQAPCGQRTLLVVMSPRGFPLGEHRRIGDVPMPPHAELSHVPLIVHFPDQTGASDRSPALVQPRDLAPTLLEWFGLPGAQGSSQESPATIGRSLLPIARGEQDAFRDRTLVACGNWRAIRTPAWFLCVDSAGETSNASGNAVNAQLFTKPDDRWELNDVADRCQNVVELLSAHLDAAPADNTQEPLADILLSGME